MQVCCLDCADFTADKIGFGAGIGRCESYEAGLLNNPNERDKRLALLARDNLNHDIFWGGTGKRSCKVFKPATT